MGDKAPSDFPYRSLRLDVTDHFETTREGVSVALLKNDHRQHRQSVQAPRSEDARPARISGENRETQRQQWRQQTANRIGVAQKHQSRDKTNHLEPFPLF